jgi:hypothetical protein
MLVDMLNVIAQHGGEMAGPGDQDVVEAPGVASR